VAARAEGRRASARHRIAGLAPSPFPDVARNSRAALHFHPDRLETDVELLVADPSFAHGPVGELLTDLAAQYRIPLAWCPGLELDFDAVPDDFLGPAMPPPARELAHGWAEADERLTAAMIGRAAVSAGDDPARLQLLKQLWHTLVAYGSCT